MLRMHLCNTSPGDTMLLQALDRVLDTDLYAPV